MTAYADFIASKRRELKPMGFNADDLLVPEMLFDWQKIVVKWAVNRGRAALFASFGLGKTAMQLAWALQVANKTNGAVMLHCPIGVRQQTVREATKFGISSQVIVKSCDSQEEVPKNEPCIVISNYEKLHKFDTKLFKGVVLDECFPAGTRLDTPLGQKPIEDFHVGDKILNASGIDVVSDIHRREVQYAAKIRIEGSTGIITSPNHPIFTNRGWVCSQDLEPGDCVLLTKKAVRILRNDIPAFSISGVGDGSFLREVLLSEMADETAGAYRESSHSRDSEKEGTSEVGVVQSWKSESDRRKEENRGLQSYAEPTSQREGQPDIESHEPRTFRAWRKRQGDDGTTETPSGCSWGWVGERVSLVLGETSSRFSDELQARLSQQRNESRYRGGWTVTCVSEEEIAGQEERRKAGFFRVESLEILERGHPELERLRDANGKLYFYDIGATRHPSYSVEGYLVHNSSILKNYTGVTKRNLIESYKDCPYRLCCTATPAPNDYMELGNHSDFLGVLPASEMLSRWFINDTMKAGGYRLRGHAQKDFWRWISSWAMCCCFPSDLGDEFSDEGYILPPLNRFDHIVDFEREWKSGFLFGGGPINATSLHKVKRESVNHRAAKVAELIANDPTGDNWLVWCDTDYEADALLSAIKEPSLYEVRGSQKESEKERRLSAFTNGEVRVLISKPEIAGLGLNFQHCHNMAFVGLSFSFERFFQAVHRCWRFGQKHPVNMHVVSTESESRIDKTVSRKEDSFKHMQRSMADCMRDFQIEGLRGDLTRDTYKAENKIQIPSWMSV